MSIVVGQIHCIAYCDVFLCIYVLNYKYVQILYSLNFFLRLWGTISKMGKLQFFGLLLHD